jgi:hypothetical protein
MVINFLEVKDVTPKLDTPKAPRTPSEVCEIARKFTVRVYCQGIPPKTSESAGPLALSPSDVADFGQAVAERPVVLPLKGVAEPLAGSLPYDQNRTPTRLCRPSALVGQNGLIA